MESMLNISDSQEYVSVIELNKYKEKVEQLEKENKQIKQEFKNYKENVEDLIKKSIEKALNEYESSEIIRLENENKSLKEYIFKLEQKENISSDTSNLPPSQDPIWHKDTKVRDSRSQKESNKKVGGQEGHTKHKLEKFSEEEITEVKEYKLNSCTDCGCKDLEFIGIEEHDELDFEIIIKKIRHKFYKYTCKKCGKIVMSKVPVTLVAENQYGSNVQALGLALVEIGDVSYKRTRDLMNGLTDGEIKFAWSCRENQVVKWIFVGGKVKRSWVWKNDSLDNTEWCDKWSLKVKWVLIWDNFENDLMKASRSHIENWRGKDWAIREDDDRKPLIMDWASVLIEYSPSIFTQSTMPPGAEYFTTALDVYKK